MAVTVDSDLTGIARTPTTTLSGSGTVSATLSKNALGLEKDSSGVAINENLAGVFINQTTTLGQGLVSYWDLNDAANGVRLDKLGSNHLTDNNTVGTNTGPDSVSNSAADFVAANLEGLTRAGASCTGIDSITSDFTINAWVYATNASTQKTIFRKGAGSDVNPGFWLQIAAVGRYACIYGDGSAARKSITPTGTAVVSLNTWTMVTVTFDRDGLMSMFINTGVPTGTSTTSIATQPGNIGTSSMDIGGNGVSTSFDGRIARVAFWNRLLSGAEITSLYNGGVGRLYSQL